MEPEKTIKVMVVDDHALLREGLILMLRQYHDMEVICQAKDGNDFLNKFISCKPDVVLMDINMPESNGIEATHEALKIDPTLRIIALSTNDDQQNYLEMLHAGACGYLLKICESSELAKAIRDVSQGRMYFSQQLLRMLIAGISHTETAKYDTNAVGHNTDISPRELEVLVLLGEGMSNIEIADALSLSVRTVEGYRQKLLIKTGSRNTVTLILWAIKNKILSINN